MVIGMLLQCLHNVVPISVCYIRSFADFPRSIKLIQYRLYQVIFVHGNEIVIF